MYSQLPCCCRLGQGKEADVCGRCRQPTLPVSLTSRQQQTTAGLHAAVAAGGYLLAYENDNVQQGDVLLVTRLSKLTMLLEYPNVGPNDPAVMWIQK